MIAVCLRYTSTDTVSIWPRALPPTWGQSWDLMSCHVSTCDSPGWWSGMTHSPVRCLIHNGLYPYRELECSPEEKKQKKKNRVQGIANEKPKSPDRGNIIESVVVRREENEWDARGGYAVDIKSSVVRADSLFCGRTTYTRHSFPQTLWFSLNWKETRPLFELSSRGGNFSDLRFGLKSTTRFLRGIIPYCPAALFNSSAY